MRRRRSRQRKPEVKKRFEKWYKKNYQQNAASGNDDFTHVVLPVPLGPKRKKLLSTGFFMILLNITPNYTYFWKYQLQNSYLFGIVNSITSRFLEAFCTSIAYCKSVLYICKTANCFKSKHGLKGFAVSYFMKYKIQNLLLKHGYKLTRFMPRPMIQFCKEHFNYPVIGMEIGVWHGDNTAEILTALNVKRMYLIDPYLAYEDTNEDYSQELLNRAQSIAVKRLKGCIWTDRNSSIEPLDFIYIDGDHSYLSVKNDIYFALSLVKKGGVIGGHDYTMDYPGVIKAVSEIFPNHNHFTPDWWVVV